MRAKFQTTVFRAGVGLVALGSTIYAKGLPGFWLPFSLGVILIVWSLKRYPSDRDGRRGRPRPANAERRALGAIASAPRSASAPHRKA
jgi:hypothetical protein